MGEPTFYYSSTNNTNYPTIIEWNGESVTYTKEPVKEVPDFKDGWEALEWMEAQL